MPVHTLKKLNTAAFNTLLCLTLFGSLSSASQANDFITEPNYAAFRDKMQQQYQFTGEQVDAAMSSATRIDRILSIMTKPGESKEWYEYRPQFVTDATISRGVRFKQQYADALNRAEKQYGVPQAIILGILGVETSFGQNKGSFRTIDALSTLAFGYPRRAEYFTDELAALLVLAKEQGVAAESIKGSYAGAIGFPQFMPSNIRLLGVDFNKDGKVDISNSAEDAIGSIAHYLAEKGWQRGQPIGLRARYQGSDDTQVVAKDLTQPRPAGELALLGLTPLDSSVSIDPLQMVNGVRLMDSNGPIYWITYPNYQVITTYNRSRLYATAVWQLGEAIVSR